MTRRCCSPRRCSVHPANGGRGHRRSPVRTGAGLGDVGRALGAVHRSAVAMGRGSCSVHGTERSPPGGVRLLGAWGPHLGVAARRAGVGDLDARPRPSAASQPEQALAALPRARGARSRLCRRRLPDRARSGGCRCLSHAWSVDRRRRTRPAPELYRLLQPTVVLEPGAGGVSSDLGFAAEAVSRDTRVCVYDRAGRGWSEPADTPPDATQIVTDLNTLLHRGHVPGAYVLAGPARLVGLLRGEYRFRSCPLVVPTAVGAGDEQVLALQLFEACDGHSAGTRSPVTGQAMRTGGTVTLPTSLPIVPRAQAMSPSARRESSVRLGRGDLYASSNCPSMRCQASSSLS